MKTVLIVAVLAMGCLVFLFLHEPSKPKAAMKNGEGKVVIRGGNAPTDEEKIAMLRTEAHKRGLQWEIFCVSWSDEDTFNASAWHPGHDDYKHDRWIVEMPTQADAAYQLYLSIQGDPTHPASPPVKPVEMRHKFCPPKISGN